jgi:hypothetical protein
MSGASRFLFRWDDMWKNDRLDIVAEAAGKTYGSKVDGADGDLSLFGAYRRSLLSRWVLDFSGGITSFRRSQEVSEDPVFDFDLRNLDGRVGFVPGTAWLLTAGVQHNWIDFPGRAADADTDSTDVIEEQKQLSFSLAAIRRFGSNQFIAAEAIYRRTTSNAELSQYEGPIVWLRSRAKLHPRWFLSGYVGFGHRSYDNYILPPPDTLQTRDDQTWQFGLTLARQLSPRTNLFLDATYTHQTSNAPNIPFDQTRVKLGIAITFISTQEPRLHTAESSTTPTVTPQGVRFRYRGPRAGTVALVGGFNGWNPDRHRLQPAGNTGLWEIVLPLPGGVWRYAFVVDGEWISPPDAPRYEDDGFGGRHGVLEVPVRQEDEPVTDGQESRRRG